MEKKKSKKIDRMLVVTAIIDALLLILLLCLRSCSHEAVPVVPEDNISDVDGVDDAMNVGSSGDLKITLLWDFEGDIDLHVIQPDGVELFYRNKYDALSGGQLDVDNTAGGPGSAENMYWQTAPSGQYRIYLNYYQPSTATRVIGHGNCRVVVIKQGVQPRTFNVPMSSVGQNNEVAVFTVR